jgi:ribosomal protein L37E
MTLPAPSPQIDMGPTSSLLQQGSPKGLYTYFILACCKNYFECMRSGQDSFNIEYATTALIAFCPNRVKRQELWDRYQKDKEDTHNTAYASVQTVGELISYLSEMLEFEEQSNAGIL